MESQTMSLSKTNLKLTNFKITKKLNWKKLISSQELYTKENLIDIETKAELYSNILNNEAEFKPFVATMVSNGDSFQDFTSFKTLKPIIVVALAVSAIAISIVTFAEFMIIPTISIGFAWMLMYSFSKIIPSKYTEDTQILKSKATKIYELRWGEGSRLSFSNFNKGIGLIGVRNNKLIGLHIPLKDHAGNYVISCDPNFLANEASEILIDSQVVYMVGDKGFWYACNAGTHYEKIVNAVNARELCLGSGSLSAMLKHNKLSITLNEKELLG